MNNIVNFTIQKQKYIEASTLFNSIDRGYMPSILTGKGPDDISENSIIGLHPYKRKIFYNKSIWKELDNLNNSTDFHKKPYPINKLGAIGFISYEALHTLEEVEKLTTDHFSMPLGEWIIYNTYYFFDNSKKVLYKIDINYKEISSLKGNSHKDIGFNVNNLKSDFSPKEYKNRVEIIREEIKKGEVYEVNLTQGIVGDFKGSPYSLFKKLYAQNTAPYSAYLERDEFTIISNSPEMFLKAEKKKIETRPIKGTIKRGENLKEDKKNIKELENSLKNQSELYMIIDLMRNDLSKVCSIGSVNVKTIKRVEKYKNVFHLVSIIEGELLKDYSYIDLFKATFPGGSITGCPKVECMKLTEKLEK